METRRLHHEELAMRRMQHGDVAILLTVLVALALVGGGLAHLTSGAPVGPWSMVGWPDQDVTTTPTDAATSTDVGTPATTGTPVTPTLTVSTTATLDDWPTATATLPISVTATTPISATATLDGPPTATPSPAPAPRQPASAVLPYASRNAPLPAPTPRVWGLQLPLDEDPPRFAVDAEIELPRAKRAGITAARTNIRWSVIEPTDTTPESYDWSATDQRLAAYARHGFDVLGTIVDYPHWATEYGCGGALLPGQEDAWREFVRALVTRYGRAPYRIRAWEIGNEVDGETLVRDDDRQRPEGWGPGEPTVPHGGCWGDRAPQYKEFLRLAYEEIKAVDPGATVTIGGLAYVQDMSDFIPSFFDDLLAAGAAPYFDVMNFHWFPDITQPLDGLGRLARLRASMARVGVRKAIWITETFRVTFTTAPESERRQIDFLTREIVEVLAAPDVERAYWYGWIDFPPDYGNLRQNQRGLVRGDHTPKAAFQVLPYTVRFTGALPSDASRGNVTAIRFRRDRTGEDYLVAWSRDGHLQPYALDVPPGTVAHATWFPPDQVLAGRGGATADVAAPDGVLSLGVGADPLFVEIAGP